MFPNAPAMGGLPPQLLAMMAQTAGGGAPASGPQMPVPPVTLGGPTQAPNTVGGALTAQATMPTPPNSPEELEERKGLWAAFWDRTKNDPNFSRALITFGARAMMNNPGQGTAGNISQAILDATNLYHGLEERDRQQALQSEELAYQKDLDQQKLGLQERGVAAQEARTELAKEDGERESQMLDIQKALADAEIALKNAQAKAVGDTTAAAGATQLYNDRLADVLLAMDSKKPEEQQQFKGDRDAAFKAAFDMMNQRDNMTKSQFVSGLIMRMPPEMLMEQADMQANAEEGEETPDLVGQYVSYVNGLADQLYQQPTAGAETTAPATPTEEEWRTSPSGARYKIIKDLGDGRVQIQIEGEETTRTGPKSALGL